MQERVESDNTESFIVHESLDRFIINSHAFHNAHLLRAAFPRDLLAPIPLFEDRRGKHDEFASALREKQTTMISKRKAARADAKKSTKAATKKSAPRKRKAPTEVESDNDGDGGENTAGPSKPPLKRARTAKKTPGNPAPVVVDGGSLAAGRPKRAITRTVRAKALDDALDDDSEEEEDGESSEEDSDMLFGSDDDYSD